MSEPRKPAYQLRINHKDGAEQTFQAYSGKEIKSKYRNIGAAWPGRYEETPFSLTFEKGTKLVLADGTEYDLGECYLDLRLPYDPDRSNKSSPTTAKAATAAGKKAAEKKPARKPVEDPFA